MIQAGAGVAARVRYCIYSYLAESELALSTDFRKFLLTFASPGGREKFAICRDICLIFSSAPPSCVLVARNVEAKTQELTLGKAGMVAINMFVIENNARVSAFYVRM